MVSTVPTNNAAIRERLSMGRWRSAQRRHLVVWLIGAGSPDDPPIASPCPGDPPVSTPCAGDPPISPFTKGGLSGGCAGWTRNTKARPGPKFRPHRSQVRWLLRLFVSRPQYLLHDVLCQLLGASSDKKGHSLCLLTGDKLICL